MRAFGTITQPQLDALKDGIEVDGVNYGPIEATLERQQGSNVWLLLGLREGKNREVKNVLAALGLKVNRLIRVSFGPFQLSDLPIGEIEVVKAKILRDQLGKRLADEAGVDFDSDLPEPAAIKLARKATNPALRASAPGKEPARRSLPGRARSDDGDVGRYRFRRFQGAIDPHLSPVLHPYNGVSADLHGSITYVRRNDPGCYLTASGSAPAFNVTGIRR